MTGVIEMPVSRPPTKADLADLADRPDDGHRQVPAEPVDSDLPR